MKEFDDLKAAVAANTAVEASAAQPIGGLASQVKALAMAAGDGTVAASDVEALATEIQSNADALAAAITANTPAATPADQAQS